MTPVEIYQYIKDAKNISIQNQKKDLFNIVVSLAALFKKDILEKYVNALDEEAGEETNIKEKQYKRSMKELGKLNSLFSKAM